MKIKNIRLTTHIKNIKMLKVVVTKTLIEEYVISNNISDNMKERIYTYFKIEVE